MASEKENNPSQNGAHILVIEDDAFMSGLLNRKLAQENFKISAATNTEEAKQVLAKDPVNLILLDIVLPGVDGMTFLTELKKSPEYKNIPVVIISNLGQEEEVEKGIKEGASDYLIKANSTPGEIANKVKELLDKK